MPTTLPPVTCSTLELTFLASLLGAQSLTGVPNPVAGWSDDAVGTAWAGVQQALARRGIISIHPDGSLGIAEEVAELVGICGYAEATFMLTYATAEGDIAGHHFHIIRQSAVEVILTQGPELSCQLVGLETPAVLDRVAALFRLGGQSAPRVPNGRLKEGGLCQARRAAELVGAEAAAERLLGAGLDPRTAAALAATLAHPAGNGALVVIPGNQAAAEMDGISLLEGENGLWLLRSVGPGTARHVDVVPCSAADLREFLRAVMNRALPGRLL